MQQMGGPGEDSTGSYQADMKARKTPARAATGLSLAPLAECARYGASADVWCARLGGQATCAKTGEGLMEGMEWIAQRVKGEAAATTPVSSPQPSPAKPLAPQMRA